jgi:hypothetical protein
MVHLRRPRRRLSMGVDRISGRAGPAAATDASGAAKPGAAGEAAAFAALLDSPAAAPSAHAASEAAPLSGLSWIQEGVTDALSRDAKDRDARRHGRAMLQALADVQRALLGGDDGRAQAALTALASIAEEGREADDPVLRLIVREIGVRAAVELARARRQHDVSTA